MRARARGRVSARVCLCVCGFAGALACVCALVALLTQLAKLIHLIVLSSVASLDPPYFPTLSHKRHDCGKNVIELKVCVFSSSTVFI